MGSSRSPDFTAAVEMVGSTDPRAYRGRGFFYHHQGRFELALADYTAGAKLFPDNGAFPNGQGLALMEHGKFEEAINRFDEAIRLDPTSGVFILGRAEAYNRSDRPQTALDDYDKALALGYLTQNDTYRLRVGVGDAHLKLKNEKAAIESLDKAVELSPNSTKKHLPGRGWVERGRSNAMARLRRPWTAGDIEKLLNMAQKYPTRQVVMTQVEIGVRPTAEAPAQTLPDQMNWRRRAAPWRRPSIGPVRLRYRVSRRPAQSGPPDGAVQSLSKGLQADRTRRKSHRRRIASPSPTLGLPRDRNPFSENCSPKPKAG
jgi:tetratricopeptide (TPR) repeat protein